MATNLVPASKTNGDAAEIPTFSIKAGLAQMLKVRAFGTVVVVHVQLIARISS